MGTRSVPVTKNSSRFWSAGLRPCATSQNQRTGCERARVGAGKPGSREWEGQGRGRGRRAGRGSEGGEADGTCIRSWHACVQLSYSAAHLCAAAPRSRACNRRRTAWRPPDPPAPTAGCRTPAMTVVIAIASRHVTVAAPDPHAHADTHIYRHAHADTLTHTYTQTRTSSSSSEGLNQRSAAPPHRRRKPRRKGPNCRAIES
jgi:hypothetical protein